MGSYYLTDTDFFRDDKKGLETDSADVCTALQMYLSQPNCTLKNGKKDAFYFTHILPQ